jgi:hypothetical protein
MCILKVVNMLLMHIPIRTNCSFVKQWSQSRAVRTAVPFWADVHEGDYLAKSGMFSTASDQVLVYFTLVLWILGNVYSFGEGLALENIRNRSITSILQPKWIWSCWRSILACFPGACERFRLPLGMQCYLKCWIFKLQCYLECTTELSDEVGLCSSWIADVQNAKWLAVANWRRWARKTLKFAIVQPVGFLLLKLPFLIDVHTWSYRHVANAHSDSYKLLVCQEMISNSRSRVRSSLLSRCAWGRLSHEKWHVFGCIWQSPCLLHIGVMATRKCI